MLVSVLVTTYNSGRFLRETLDSILAQSFRDFEVVVVDDGSTDGTPDFVRSYLARDSRIRLVEKAHSGIPDTYNRGVRECRGEYIARIGHDDRMDPYRLELQVAAMERNPDVGVVHTNAITIDGHGRVIGRWDSADYGPAHLTHLFFRICNNIIDPSTMVRKAVYDDVGLYDLELQMANDWDLWCRASRNWRFLHIPLPLVHYRRHGGNYSDERNRAEERREVAIILERLATKYRTLQELIPEVDWSLPDAEGRARAIAHEVLLRRGYPELADKLFPRGSKATRGDGAAVGAPASLATGLHAGAPAPGTTGIPARDPVSPARVNPGRDSGPVATGLAPGAASPLAAIPGAHPAAGESGRNVLVVASELPIHDRCSGYFRLFQVVRMLRAAGHHVTYVARAGSGGNDDAPYLALMRDLGVETYAYDPDKVRQKWGVSLDRLPRVDLKQIMSDRDFDAAYLYSYDVAGQYLDEIRACSPRTRIVVDSVDVHFLREERKARLANDAEALAAARATRARELAVYRKADVVVVLTAEDRRALEEADPGLAIASLPNIHPVPGRVAPFESRRDLLFVGNFIHDPNVDGVRWFCETIWPEIALHLPDARLILAGNAPTDEIRALAGPRVVVTGFVPDLQPYLDGCRVSIAPLRYGAGMKGKVGEAMASGLPVVATSVAAEGMGLVSGEHLLVADDPEEFAAAVCRLYQDRDLWERLSAAGRTAIRERMAPAAVAAKLEAILFGASVGAGAGSVAAQSRDSGDRAATRATAPPPARRQEGSARLRILMVMYGWAESGGGTILPRMVARELAGRGHEVMVFYAGARQMPGEPPYHVLSHEEDGVQLRGLFNRPSLFADIGAPGRDVSDPVITEIFRQILDEFRPDVVHAHNFHNLGVELAEEIGRRKLRAFFTPHNYWLVCPRLYLFDDTYTLCAGPGDGSRCASCVGRPGAEAEYAARRSRLRDVVNSSGIQLLAVSQATRDVLVSNGIAPDRVAVLYQGHAPAERIWRELGASRQPAVPDGDVIFSFIGAIAPLKGLHILAAAAQKVRGRFRVHVHGGTVRSYQEMVEELDRKKILEFHGEYDHGDLPAILARTHVAIIPSICWETAPTLVGAECLAARVPVLAANFGGIPEGIEDGRNGRLFAGGDPDDLAARMQEIVDDPGLIARWQAQIRPPLPFSTYLDELEDLYRGREPASRHDTSLPAGLILDGRGPVTVSWQGDFAGDGALARLNLEVAGRLAWQPGLEIAVFPSGSIAAPESGPCAPGSGSPGHPGAPAAEPGPEERPATARESLPPALDRLVAAKGRPGSRPPLVHVRSGAATDFTPPPGGAWVQVLDWPSGESPGGWATAPHDLLDEVWVLAAWQRDALVAGGFPAERIRLLAPQAGWEEVGAACRARLEALARQTPRRFLPTAVDPARFNPGVEPLAIEGLRGRNFLLRPDWRDDRWIEALRAYLAAFEPADDVALVIRAEPGEPRTPGEPGEPGAPAAAERVLAAIARLGRDPDEIPDVVIVDRALSPDRAGGLYTACQAFIDLGNALHAREAAACGLEVLQVEQLRAPARPPLSPSAEPTSPGPSPLPPFSPSTGPSPEPSPGPGPGPSRGPLASQPPLPCSDPPGSTDSALPAPSSPTPERWPSPASTPSTAPSPHASAAGLRILMVMYGWTESGGGTILPRAIARQLVRRGHRVMVFYAGCGPGPRPTPYDVHAHEEDGVQLRGVFNRPSEFGDYENPEREILDPPILEAFQQALDDFRPDVVHVHNLHNLGAALAEEIGARGIRAFFTPHNYWLVCPRIYLYQGDYGLCDGPGDGVRCAACVGQPSRPEGYVARRKLVREIFNGSGMVCLAVSRAVRDVLVANGFAPDRVKVLYQGHAQADRLWAEVGSHRKPAVPEGDIVFSFIGSALPQKGAHLLVQAAQQLRGRFQVRVYGDIGPENYRQDLLALDKAGAVQFRGKYDYAEMAGIFRETHVAVIPSIWYDNAPLAVAECLAARVPVLGANMGGIPEFVEDGRTGRLFDGLRAEVLAARMQEIIDRPELVAEWQAHILPPLSFDTYLSELEALYRGEFPAAAGAEATGDEEAAATPLSDPGPAAIRTALPAGLDPAPARDASCPISVAWEGAQFIYHSLAHVNREVCLQLLEDPGIELKLIPTENPFFDPREVPRYVPLIAPHRQPRSRPPQVHVRHQWPPNFDPPPSGCWVIIQPWEFGGIPAEWVVPMRDVVDEIWVPSNWVREGYIKSGVPGEKVVVVPNGVDVELFRPDGPTFPLRTQKRFKFLFLGGTLGRKGIDLLIDAYRAAFSAADDVCLVIKGSGKGHVYVNFRIEDYLAEVRQNPDAPEIEYLDQELTDEEIAALYRSVDALAHPYRGEGFAMPIAEAMASGLPVIVPEYGACLDFCDRETAFMIPSTEVGIQFDWLPPAAVGYWWGEPDRGMLALLMRQIVANPERAREIGRKGRERIVANFRWDQVAAKYRERIRMLADRTPLRFSPGFLDPVRFNPRVQPLEIDGLRAYNFLLRPDFAGERWVEALRAYLDAFRPDDDVALVIRGEPGRSGVAEAVLEAIVRTGHDPEAIPDIVIVDQVLSYDREGGLYTACQAFLDCGHPGHRLEAEACGIQVLADLSATSLARCAGGTASILEPIGEPAG